MLQPHPYTEPARAFEDRRRIEGLRRLLNRSEASVRQLSKERDLARWQLLLLRDELARLQAENERLRRSVDRPPAG